MIDGIGRPLDVIYPPQTNLDGTRRRSSLWSCIMVPPGWSPDGKRNTLLNLFNRKSSMAEALNGTLVAGSEEATVAFNEVDLGGKKKDELQ